jgi:hypothetical protein
MRTPFEPLGLIFNRLLRLLDLHRGASLLRALLLVVAVESRQ